MPDIAFRVVIPARFASTRFPGKVLAELHGRPMLQHVYDRARASAAIDVLVATDDGNIADAANVFGAEVVMTRADHQSGTDRIAEVAEQKAWSDDEIVVNVQGDAPLIPSESISRVAGLLQENPSASIATLCTPIVGAEEYTDPNVVKVVFDASGRALYFSRASIPALAYDRDDELSPRAWRHVGIYAYRVAALRRLTSAEPCELERTEKLEQLRAMWLGMEIRVGVAAQALGPDVDTPEDLLAAERFLDA